MFRFLLFLNYILTFSVLLTLISIDDVQVQLCRHLLKTVCTDIVNQAVSLLAAEHMLTMNDDSALTTEVCCL